jgi:NitT/TauT family transport system substrate-binding protein
MRAITIGIAHRGAGLSPVFAAIEGGCFAAEGLQVTTRSFPGHPAALAALIAGEVDFINTVGAELVLANETLAGDAVVVASAIGRSATQVSARPGLQTLDSLRGKRWGVVKRKDADECVIRLAFERWGWDIERDAQIVEVGGDRPRLDALLDPDQVDVAIMHAPEPFQAERRGWRIVEDLGRHDVAFQNSCAATSRRFLEREPDTVDRYVAAYTKAVWRFRTESEFGLDILRRFTGESDESVLLSTWVLFARLMGGMMYPSVEGLRNAVDVLFRMGAIDRRVDHTSYLTLEPVARFEAGGGFAAIMRR